NEPRDEVALRHAVGHAPVWKEVQSTDGGPDARRLPVRLADDNPVPQAHDVVLDRLELIGRDVDQHVAIAVNLFLQQVADAPLVESKLLEPLVGGNIHLRQGRAIDAPRDPHAVATLEFSQAGFQPGVERVAVIVGSTGWAQITLDDQPMPDIGYPLVLFSWPQGAARRYLMPAATGDDLLIPRNCLIDLPEHGGAAPGRGIRAEIVWHLRLGPRDAPSARPWSWIEDAFPPLGLR